MQYQYTRGLRSKPSVNVWHIVYSIVHTCVPNLRCFSSQAGERGHCYGVGGFANTIVNYLLECYDLKIMRRLSYNSSFSSTTWWTREQLRMDSNRRLSDPFLALPEP